MSSGAQIKGHVAGIAMGLITDGKRHAILSDILGSEDHLGDMDFKVAGTREGITAIQLDLKIEGISFELLTEALAQAKTGREHILDIMYDSIPEVQEMSEYAPKILSVQIAPEKIEEQFRVVKQTIGTLLLHGVAADAEVRLSD